MREVVWLPALTAIDEMPAYLAGAFNLRGDFIPVIDLGLRFGEPQAHRRTGDQVVILERGPLRVGLIVQGLDDVIDIDCASLEAVETYQLPGSQHVFISGVLKRDGQLLMQLDIDALFSAAPVAPPGVNDTGSAALPALDLPLGDPNRSPAGGVVEK